MSEEHLSPPHGEASLERACTELRRILGIMARLRAEDGCPWDRKQTFDSLKPYLIEEAYEVLDAMEGQNDRDHCEELGDLLFQIVFHAQIAAEQGSWEFADVAKAIADKIESRHPHVFGSAGPVDEAEIDLHWVKIKAAEKARKAGRRVSVIDGVPRHAPGLLRAERIGEKASRIGFDWPDAGSVRRKVDEELAELDEAIASGDREAIASELGDVLFSLSNLARHLGTPAEDALRGSIHRFERRFHRVEEGLEARGRGAGERIEPELLESLWQEAKRKERESGGS